ncbi:phosphatase PAP2 family protein [Ruminococcaceae bacterium OttesenSCG-928-D13]|nr:phosphatase PAP2 family protein [Ruminococcaceae bacterium OttesenSCG-928-D13]
MSEGKKPSQQHNQSARVFTIAILIYAVGLFLGAFYDLPLTRAAYNPTSLFGIVMEAVGWYPAFLPSLLLFILWTFQKNLPQNRLWQRPVCGLASAGGLGALYLVSGRYLARRGMFTALEGLSLWLWVALGVAFAAILVIIVLRMVPSTRVKMTFFGIWGTVYMVANQVVTYPIKVAWARSRFDDMAAIGSFEAFTPWYQPFGNGGSSFPSGHTANAAGIFMLLVLCDLFPAWHRRSKTVYVVCWGYIAVMAAARIIIGRHYLSDTLAASAIMAVLFYAMRSTKLYQAQLRKTLSKAAEEGTPNAI